MTTIDLLTIKTLGQQIANILDSNHINYLVYGSFGKYLHGFDIDKCNDIDIIIKEIDLNKIYEVFKSDYNCFLYKYGLHANSKYFANYKNETFDISFDSYEHYFLDNGIKLNFHKDCQIIDGIKCISFAQADIQF
ncbi:hypothetical protein IPJ91_02795 [bacterium]|nr:MAG: hypothetical protein IPJ91_02795 [bacterium]